MYNKHNGDKKKHYLTVSTLQNERCFFYNLQKILNCLLQGFRLLVYMAVLKNGILLSKDIGQWPTKFDFDLFVSSFDIYIHVVNF